MHGDRDAFGVLASRSLDRLAGAAGLILRDRDQVDDAVQEALVRAWRHLPALRDPDRFDAWVYRVLVRSCHDQIRRRRREHLVDRQRDPLAATPDGLDIVADRDELSSALGQLSDEQRAVVILHYYVGLSHPEIAEAIGKPLGTVKSRLSRALAYLQAALAADARVSPSEERMT